MDAIIIDDEKHCRHVLSLLLARHCPEVNVVAECADGTTALQAIAEHRPQLLFLDIEMPGMNGFELLERCTDKGFSVIFTTAYNEYAIKAIRHSALDYLLKPVDKNELEQSVIKAQKQCNKDSGNIEKLIGLLRERKSPEPVALSTLGGLIVINTDDLLYCESDGPYTNFIFIEQKPILLSKTLKEVEEVLTSRNFLRVHNSFLINMKYVRKYLNGNGGDVVMNNGKTIPVSRGKKAFFLEHLERI